MVLEVCGKYAVSVFLVESKRSMNSAFKALN